MKRKFLALILTIVSVFTVFAIANKDAKDANAATATTVYMKPSSDWTSSGAWFAAYFYGSGNAEWVKMTDPECDGIFEAAVPSGKTKVIFVRMNSGKTGLDWGSKWNQTDDLTVPTNNNILYTIKGWNSGSWGTYSFTQPTITLVGDLPGANWDTAAVKYLFNHVGNNVHKLYVNIAAGTYSVKLAVNKSWDVSFGGSTLNEGGNCVFNGSDNATLKLTTGGEYVFTFDGPTKTLSVSPVPTLETILTNGYNNGTYTRNTTIFIDKTKIAHDYKNTFHNPQGGDNVKLTRTTKFVGDYLYFDEGANSYGFGTSADGKLVSFKGTSYTASTSGINAIENEFYTIYDLIAHAGSFTYENGVYTYEPADKVENDPIFAIAVGFTAPGWISPDSDYVDYTKVTVELDGTIKLWVSAGNSGIVTSAAEGAHCLFSQAVISK